MTNTVKTNDTLKKNREQFNNELKMFINQKLFDKHIISEDMYWSAKELLLKQVADNAIGSVLLYCGTLPSYR